MIQIPPTLFRGIKSISDRSDFLAVWTVISKPHCTAIPTPHVQAKTATGHLHVATFYNRALTRMSADPRKLKLNISWAISLGDKKIVGSFVFFEHQKDYISTYAVAPPCGSPVGGPRHLQRCKKTLIEPDQHTQNNQGNIIAFTSYSFPRGT